MKKKYVKFPNESYFAEMMINMEEFILKNEFKDEIFGIYKGLTISIKK